ncbi:MULTISPECIES: GNAT family N-acetyltransferase [unclassified Achromobacter]|uniref:GNAT family N-acetyltransferase n=1 Tax=unclassified Achromobacter TaxID=2626865 RepID=UPI000B5196B1|nr:MULTISPECIES: N-acetyltransferase [unclassified Achromobacter]OWT73592.1 GNAT family N-acetyltransferase [Achromobacter sp. HZ34]OWT79491.1 GNAT family N-acetyltransferase [Achromobacter sp. HZ28]
MSIQKEAFEVRRLTPADAAGFQALRLAALEECPTAFGASLEDERALELQAVAQRIAPADHGDAGGVGAFDGPDLVGIACVFRARGRKERHKAYLVSVYVAPAWRGKGLSGKVVDAAIGLARAMPGVRRINLTVNVANRSALALYRRRGFEVYGQEAEGLCVDGVYQDEYLMSLVLH